MYPGLEGFLHGSIQPGQFFPDSEFLQEISCIFIVHQAFIFIIEINQIPIADKTCRNREIKDPFIIQAVQLAAAYHQIFKQAVNIADCIGSIRQGRQLLFQFSRSAVL